MTIVKLERVAKNAIARFLGERPESAWQWALLIVPSALPAAGYLGARYFEAHPGTWIDIRPQLTFAGAWIASVVFLLIALWRRVRWTLPALALNLLLLASGVLAPRFLKPAQAVWGDHGVYQFSVLADQSLLVCGAEWVRLGPDAKFRESIHQSCGFADLVQPFADGRVVLGLYENPMLGNRAGGFRPIESLAENQRVLRGAVATPDGGSILATVSIPGGGVRFSKYRSDETLERFWTPEAPENNWSAAALAWSVVLYPDGSAAILWRDPNKVEKSAISWHAADGRLRPDTVVRDFCATCVDPKLRAGREGRVYEFGSGKEELALLRFSADGRVDPAFHPDTKALLGELGVLQSMVELPQGGILVGGLKKIVRLDESGQLDARFVCALASSARQMALQGDRLLVLDGDHLRRFDLNGSADDSWRMPRLESSIFRPSTKPVD